MKGATTDRPIFTLKELAVCQNGVFRRSTSYRFIKGPISYDWITACARLPGRALHVGACLLFLAGLQKQPVVVFSYHEARKFGVDRYAAYRALKAMEHAQLIGIVRAPGRSPRVMLLQTMADGRSCDASPLG